MRVPRGEIYRVTGIQFMAINTIYQLLAHGERGRFPSCAMPAGC